MIDYAQCCSYLVRHHLLRRPPTATEVTVKVNIPECASDVDVRTAYVVASYCTNWLQTRGIGLAARLGYERVIHVGSAVVIIKTLSANGRTTAWSLYDC